MADTGLPGSPNTGVSDASRSAEGERLGRPDRHLHPAHGAAAPLAQDRLDHVGVADADPTGGEDGVAPSAGIVQSARHGTLVVADDPEVDRLPPLLAHEGEERVAVGVPDPPRGEAEPGLDEFVPGRQDADPGTRVDDDLGRTLVGEARRGVPA